MKTLCVKSDNIKQFFVDPSDTDFPVRLVWRQHYPHKPTLATGDVQELLDVATHADEIHRRRLVE